KYKEVTSPARTESYRVDAVYKTVGKTRAAKAPEPVWREVLCDKNTSPAKVKEIQIALKQRGYDPGPADGTLGSKTVAAMQKFQADEGLAQGQMSVEAAEALGVKIH
ncbi:MAG: peptidoglycan-binding domain-containing protein, partial [Asticcacaulis sp.]